MVEQGRVACVLSLLLGPGDLAFEVLALGAELGAALLDAADEVGVEIVGGLQGADQAAALGLGVGDGAAQGLDLGSMLGCRCLGQGRLAGVEQGMPVGAEDIIGQEPAQPAEEVVLADAEDSRVPGGPVGLFRGAGVVGGLVVGYAEHAPPAQAAEDVAAQRVDTPGLRVAVEARGAARSLAAVATRRHLPRLTYLHDALTGLRAVLENPVWDQDWREPFACLDSLLTAHTTPAERAAERARITPGDQSLVDRMLRRRLEAR